MLTVDQMSRITREAILGLPPTLTTKEALAHRTRVEEELAQMRRDGLTPELPSDFD